ncbi:hypothetical protein NE237_027646 [Protea cynaroides]|uniref:Uncharacterized protein n=1 Tax=Protea cynaroides TaxID=273540 RepID=A0A9Q0GSA2_9MAGN|nr:hypothetical protein NE237_027646 [Protea cynaroides]
MSAFQTVEEFPPLPQRVEDGGKVGTIEEGELGPELGEEAAVSCGVTHGQVETVKENGADVRGRRLVASTSIRVSQFWLIHLASRKIRTLFLLEELISISPAAGVPLANSFSSLLQNLDDVVLEGTAHKVSKEQTTLSLHPPPILGYVKLPSNFRQVNIARSVLITELMQNPSRSTSSFGHVSGLNDRYPFKHPPLANLAPP